MKKLAVLWVAGVGLLSLTVVTTQGGAPQAGDLNGAINNVADLIEKGDKDRAKKAAETVAANNEVENIMTAFALRKKKGIGLGPKANEIMPDGIELKLEAVVRDGITPALLKKEGPALTRAAYVIAAVGQIAHAKAPEKDVGKAKKADWLKWSDELVKASEEFAGASKGASAADVKKTAAKVKQSCDSCHAVFK
jgi:hypothetical protein